MLENLEHPFQTGFVFASIGWLGLGLAAVYFLPESWGDPGLAAQWLVGLWLLCSLDLWVLTKTVLSCLKWMGAMDPKRGNHLFATLYWGAFKMICLGLLVMSLLKAQNAPMYSLVFGTGTLWAVPLFGGVIWNQRLLRDA